MAEENEQVEVSEAELKEARNMGWSDQDKWRGKAEDWVDAKTFLERGKHVLPIVNERNRALKTEVDTLGQELGRTQQALHAATAAIKALEESRDADVEAQVEEAKKSLKTELAAALRDGDHEAAADLTLKISDLNEAAELPSKGEETQRGGGSNDLPQIPVDVQQWFRENPDYMGGRHKALALAITDEIRKDRAHPASRLIGVPFLEAVAEEVDKVLGERSERPSKVAGGNGGDNRRTGGQGATKGYADLPADAKAYCDKMANRLVGANRAHKDVASWRASYVKQYFSQEQL